MGFCPLRLMLAVLMTAVCTCQRLSAQTTTSGALAGVVTDQSGAVVPDADVEIKDNAKGTTQSGKTGREGAYQFSFLAPSRYMLKVSHSGFRDEKRTVDVLLGPAVSVNVTFAIAEASSEIEVTDEAPLIQAENGDPSATMNQKQISEVPNPGNDLTYIVQTTPGVVMNTDVPNSPGMNFSILGMPSTSYLYSIDGVDNPPTGVLGLMLGQNQIQEATVVSTGYSGQFGNAAGGNINYVTKSGTNQFHGNAQYYWNGRVFNANDWFNNANGVPRPFDIANQWAGSFGGPVKRDRLFFFFDTEGLRVLIPSIAPVLIASPQFQAATIQNIDNRFGVTSASHIFYKKVFDLYNSAPGASSAMPGSFVPGDLGCAGPSLVSLLPAGVPCVMHFLANRGAPNQDALSAGRMDWNPARRDRVFFRFQNDSGHTKLLSPIDSVFDTETQQRWWQIHAVEIHTPSASIANQLLFAYANINFSTGVVNLARARAALPTHLFFNPPEQLADPGSSFQARNNLVQYQISEDFVKAGQKHKVGFGLNLDRLSSDFSSSDDVGWLSTTLDAFYQGGADPNSQADFSQLFQGFQSRKRYPTSWYHFGIYTQDEWRARPGLTITMTIRAEHQSNVVCQTHCFARLSGPFNAVSHDPNQPYNQAILVNQKRAFQGLDSILWSPRFSFAWQPFGVKQNTVLRGGIGIFYDSVDSVASNFVNNPPLLNSFTVTGDILSPGENNSLFAKSAASNVAFVNAFASGETVSQIENSVPYFFPPRINRTVRSWLGRSGCGLRLELQSHLKFHSTNKCFSNDRSG